MREKSVALVIKVGKTGGRLTAEAMKWAMRQYLNHPPRRGKQSVKQLVRQGAGVQNIEITDKNIKSFEHIARKYGVDFAVKKDPVEKKYLVFFKARDADALNTAFAEYTAKSLHRNKSRPSLLKQLAHYKEVVKNHAQDVAKNREKGELEH